MERSYNEDEITPSGGPRLFVRLWRPRAAPRATIMIAHGVNEHGERYAHVAARLAAEGYAVCAPDLRGHGRSAGERAMVADFGAYLDDLDAAFGWLGAQGASGPRYLLGHSMGAAVSAFYVLVRRPALAGLILSGAPVITPPNISPLMRRAAPILARLLPRLPTQPIEGISRDPEVVARTKADPLMVQSPMRAATGAALLRAIATIESHMAELTLPLLILHGTADRIVAPEGSRVLYARAGAADKTLHLYEGLYHEIFNEPEREQVLDDLCAWLAERTPAAAGTEEA